MDCCPHGLWRERERDQIEDRQTGGMVWGMEYGTLLHIRAIQEKHTDTHIFKSITQQENLSPNKRDSISWHNRGTKHGGSKRCGERVYDTRQQHNATQSNTHNASQHDTTQSQDKTRQSQNKTRTKEDKTQEKTTQHNTTQHNTRTDNTRNPAG